MNLYTASWRVALGEPRVVPVRTSVGCPKGAEGFPHIGALAPYGLFGKKMPLEEFQRRYIERLGGYGPDAIRSRLEWVAADHPDRALALCCFERRPEDCHRGIFAAWWERQTGEVIPEWESAPDPQLRMEEER